MYNERLFYMKIKNNVVFSRYLDFCVFDESTNLKNCDIITDITVHEELHF